MLSYKVMAQGEQTRLARLENNWQIIARALENADPIESIASFCQCFDVYVSFLQNEVGMTNAYSNSKNRSAYQITNNMLMKIYDKFEEAQQYLEKLNINNSKEDGLNELIFRTGIATTNSDIVLIVEVDSSLKVLTEHGEPVTRYSFVNKKTKQGKIYEEMFGIWPFAFLDIKGGKLLVFRFGRTNIYKALDLNSLKFLESPHNNEKTFMARMT